MIKEFLESLKAKNPAQPEFIQAAEEVVQSLEPVLERNPQYVKARILERITEPERIVMFRVPWLDDKGEIQVNRGYRIEFNSAIGPYKGGLRFHPTVTLGMLKFLAFEQVFKNSLTTLPMGGGKGGADFDPKGKSDFEVMKFCQSFMNELFRHVGADTDVPAGDIGVGGREIGFLFGQYKRLVNRFEGVLTGKNPKWGGSLIRPEATGYGTVYFAANMMATKNQTFEGKRVAISGSGNVAQYAVEKVLDLGGMPVTFSDSTGFIIDNEGMDRDKLAFIMELKNVRRGRIREYAEKYGCEYHEGSGLWKSGKYDVALPSATQNELDGEDARALLSNGCTCVAEGANMPSTPKAVSAFLEAGIFFGPGKAANAGGVAVSGLEMSQNSLRLSWSRDEVDNRLKDIMKSIHDASYAAAEEYGTPGNYVNGANIAGFVKVADSMMEQGLV